MATDLFRITMSRDVDRNRYLAALLSAGHVSLKSDVPKCLRPVRKRAQHQSVADITPRPPFPQMGS
jgi:hypothetical protein